jgi:hypothetical protein
MPSWRRKIFVETPIVAAFRYVVGALGRMVNSESRTAGIETLVIPT